jgi:hypothetical protein
MLSWRKHSLLGVPRESFSIARSQKGPRIQCLRSRLMRDEAAETESHAYNPDDPWSSTFWWGIDRQAFSDAG